MPKANCLSNRLAPSLMHVKFFPTDYLVSGNPRFQLDKRYFLATQSKSAIGC